LGNGATEPSVTHHYIDKAMSDRKPPQEARSRDVRFNFQIEREVDGRWIAEIPEVRGAMAYGATVEEAKAKAYAIALHAVAEDVEASREIPTSISVLEESA
jgi:predicted RNase H-like HicB family nuclease